MPYSIPKSADHTDFPLKGIAFAATAFFLLAIMNLLAKILNNDYGHHVVEIAFYRNLTSVIPFLAYILISRQYHLFITQTPRALAARSIIGTVSLITTFAAFTVLPLAEATVLLFTASLMTPAFGYFFLGEKVGIHRWSAIGLGFTGVLVMIGIQTMQGNYLGMFLALAAATMHACLGLLLRMMKKEHPVTVTFYFVLTGLVITSCLMPFFATKPETPALIMLIGTGLAGGLAQFCLSMAYKNAPVANVSPLNYTGLIWATGFDIIIFNIMPGWPVFLGAFIIVSANLYIIYRENILRKRARLEP